MTSLLQQLFDYAEETEVSECISDVAFPEPGRITFKVKFKSFSCAASRVVGHGVASYSGVLRGRNSYLDTRRCEPKRVAARVFVDGDATRQPV